MRAIWMRHSFRTILYSALLALLCCFFAVGCKKFQASSKHFRIVLDRPANPNHIPLYVGNALGYFKEEGIFLDIQKPTTDKPLAQLEEGTADMVLASLPRVFRAIARKRSISVVAKLIEKPTKGFLVLKASGIKGIEDFNGRILGYDGAYSILPSAEVILDEKNIQLGCRLNLKDESINELVSKKIDIVYGALSNIEPDYLMYICNKVLFFLASDLGMPPYEEIVIAAHSSMKRNKKTIIAFQKALQKSIDFCRAKPQLAFEMYANLLHNKSRKTVMWEEISWDKTVPLLATSQQFSYDAVQSLATWYYETGLVGTPIEITPQFIPALTKQEL